MTKSILQRLLSHPHAAVFEKGAQDELVFRVRHPLGAAWSIADGQMVVSAGALRRTYGLSTRTVSSLISALRADGFEVLHVSSRFDIMSALVLTEGEGEQGASNGDHITAFTSLLWTLFTGYARELTEAERQISQALLQMVIGTAEGEWLDLWGALYSVQRLVGETDVAYRVRIPREAFRIRVNARAIELSVKQLTGKTIRLLEPWQDVFTLDVSVLDGPHKFQDSDRIGPFFIQAVSDLSIDWSDVLPIILRNKPAGVLMLPPQVLNSSEVVVPDDWYAVSSYERFRSTDVRLEDVALLDYAEIEETSVPNIPFDHRRTILHAGSAEMSPTNWPPTPWLPVTWSDAKYIVLTDRSRSYRVYDAAIAYEGQYWPEMPWLEMPWAEINALVLTDHSRSS
jgi:biotin operon repressor